MKSNILCLIRINEEDNKHEIVDCIERGDKCMIVLDRTNFYSDKGGQQSDSGVLNIIKGSNGAEFKVSAVYSLQDYVFHFGEFESNGEGEKNVIDRIYKNDLCKCKIDEVKRFKTSLSHTAVHVLNDALRRVYRDEDSIVQIMSSAREDNFKFEFLFNKIKRFIKPSDEDIKNIQKECMETINKALPVYEGETNYEDIENGNSRIRRLRDIIYPKRVRVVSMGKKFDDVSANSENSFHELCCGTHTSNTNDLKYFEITGIESSGDFSFEIEACVGKEAAEIKSNETILNDIYEEIVKLDLNTHEGIHEVSRKCTEIELLQQYWKLSYLFRRKLFEKLEKYRPSKHQLKKQLSKYFHDKIVGMEKIDATDLYLKFVLFNSILPPMQILQILTKVSRLPNSLLAYNKCRNELIAYSYKNAETEAEHEIFFNSIENFLKHHKIQNEKAIQSTYKNIVVFKLHKNIKKDEFIDLCKNIEKN